MSFALGPYELRLLTIAGCYVLPVLGYQLVFGHAGALSLAQGAFFGLGAYATALLATLLGWNFLATFPASILLPTLVAALVAAPVLRLRSHYFALATLGIAQVVLLGAIEWTSLTGGANGVAGVPGVAIAGVAVPRGWPLLALVWAIALVAAVAIAFALATRWRVAFAVLREGPLGAAALGLDEGVLRLAAFLASAALAGAGGALYAHTLRVVSPDALGFPVMVLCLAMTVIGGATHVAGAFIGALLLVHLPEWFRFLDLYRTIAYGGALLVAVIAAPAGIAGTIGRLLPRRRPPPRRETVPPPAPPVPARLTVDGVSKRFGGVAALEDVSLALSGGEIVGLIGPNGSGKTTLLNLISGFERPDRGAVRLDDEHLDGAPPFRIARRGVARLFQTASLARDMTALETVAVARRQPLREAFPAAMHLLARVGLAAASEQRVADLAFGQRRFLELARALALRPRVLLLDEPAAGLGPEEQRALAAQLRTLAAEGMALLVIEHNMPFLLGLADRIVCLDAGRVIASGTPAEIRRHPAVAAAYLGVAA